MRRLIKPFVFVLSLVPLAGLVFIVMTGRTSANPAEDILLTTGIWAFRFLLASLAITPMRRLTGWNALIKYRRMLGLFAFFYATVHLTSYLLFDQLVMEEGVVGRVAADIAKRPFITAGMTAFLLMVPLAVTSTKGWIRRLGRRWQRLHRLVYFSAGAAALHFVWKVKVAVGEPVYYAGFLAVLLALRLVWWLPRRTGVTRPAAPSRSPREGV